MRDFSFPAKPKCLDSIEVASMPAPETKEVLGLIANTNTLGVILFLTSLSTQWHLSKNHLEVYYGLCREF
jgi:hypothetical protein